MLTRLGWIVGGCCNNKTDQKVHHVHQHYEVCECEVLHEKVNEFFALENHGTRKEFVQSADEKNVFNILKNSTRRIGNRFESGLLWKYKDIEIPNSYPMAVKRLQCIEKKIKVEPELKQILNLQIENLIQKGYAGKLDHNEQQKTSPQTWYMPMFIVRNVNKPEKIRLVWDGAAKIQGVSLNSLLYKGPDQLVALPSVLYSFRSRRVAVSGDICEMFHQVRVREEDQQAQRFLWRNGEDNRSPDVYVMEVLTFGASCSPCIVQYVKNTNADEFIKDYPRAVLAIKRNHYVDDLMDSVDSIEEAVQLAKDVRYVHSQGGFSIRGWLSNSREVMQELGEISRNEKPIEAMENNVAPLTKVLGIWWKTDADIFKFCVRFPKIHDDILRSRRMPTKREVLKVLMSVFDPLGFLAHFLMILKVLLQDIWRSAIDWDEIIPKRLQHGWEEWLRILPKVENVQIPRCYSSLTAMDGAHVQLHVFVDASENAMAAAAYFRISSGDYVNCAFVGAKTKVKPMSIPRMELQAAAIGVRLAEMIVKGHTLKIQRRIFWSDSRTVLSWLKNDPRKYNAFVMHRIGEILEASKLSEWRWIPSKENVADEATKWKKRPTFESNDRWLRGPEFLFEAEQNWPGELPIVENLEEELRPKYMMSHFIAPAPVIEAEKYKTWTNLLKSMAYVLRFIDNLKKRIRGEVLLLNKFLTSGELRRSQLGLIKMVQSEVYADEIALLLSGAGLKKTSQLSTLSPYIDNDGLLRMEGRIDNADCANYETKRPILMLRRHRVTYLLICHYHEKFHHCYDETVMNEIKQKFWIPRLRVELKSIRRKCNRCQLNRAHPRYPQMAQLPKGRLSAYTRPFTNVGVDYFGPIIVTSGRRTEKRWGVLFTCMTIRAVHLELAHSLSTDSCIMCVRNFIGRRGTPKVFYSDNGTNFKGAQKELHEAWKSLDKSKLEEHFNTTETKWLFNPPSAPHMGGVWERLVGSVKKVLKEITWNQRLQDESLLSMLIEVEAIINARPLTHVSLEDNDAEALTPNHFLLGYSNGCKPPGQFDDKDLLLRKSGKKCQQLSNLFWKRWVNEYLPTLTRRSKWFEKTKPIEKGDIVIIVDGNLPRGSWPKRIVGDVIRAKDGQVRRAVVRTATGVFIRPAVKLAVLDVKGEEDGEPTSEAAASPGGRMSLTNGQNVSNYL